MGDWFKDLHGLEQAFVLCALIGGVLFLIRLILQFVGGDSDMVADDVPDDLPADFDVEMPEDLPDGEGLLGDSDVSFKLVSFQGIMAFFLIFGMSGLMMTRTFNANAMQALIVAGLCGLGIMYLQARLMTFLLGLQSSGTIDIKNAIGKEGLVYLSIPADGTGKVQVTVQEVMKIYNAMSQDKEPLKTGERIRVTSVTGQNVLMVEKVSI